MSSLLLLIWSAVAVPSALYSLFSLLFLVTLSQGISGKRKLSWESAYCRLVCHPCYGFVTDGRESDRRALCLLGRWSWMAWESRQSKLLSSIHPWFLLHLFTPGYWLYYWIITGNIPPNALPTHLLDLVYSNINKVATIKGLCALQESHLYLCYMWCFLREIWTHVSWPLMGHWWNTKEFIPFKYLVDPNEVLGINYMSVGWPLGILITEKSILSWMTTQKVAFLKISTQIEGNASKDAPPSSYCSFHIWSFD